MPTVRVDNNLTEDTARQRTVEYLTETLAALPPNYSLSRQDPKYAHSRFGDAVTAPCVDDDTAKDVPWNVGVNYWVVGVPDDMGVAALELFADVWNKFGWSPQRSDEGTTTVVRARSQDDYAFVATVNKNGSLAVSASSPCFPQSAKGGSPVPQDIPHPA